ncbi:MAG: helix-turn-helix domain-containing protein [Intestinibaculum porci]|uniref:helix-turn-helix domain-containing protein n=1 Tax=Intestinibaculum porci TaxID=2487118 RepID=UPI003F000800
MNNLGEEIKKKRLEKGLTIEELSQKTMLSVAIIRDIENGAFNRYEGDETYVKMYLRKISSALDMDEDQITQAYVNLTQQLKAEEEEEANKKAEESEQELQKRKDFQFERPNYNTKGSVYADKPHLKYVRGIIVVVLISLICAVVYIGVSVGKSGSENTKYTNTSNTATGKVNTKKKSSTATKKKETKKKAAKKKSSTQVTFKRLGTFQYQMVLPKDTKNVKLKIVFGARCWVGFSANGASLNGLSSKIYNAGDTVEQTIDTTTLRQLTVRSGNNTGTKYYINNQQIPLTDAESKMTVTRLILTVAKS